MELNERMNTNTEDEERDSPEELPPTGERRERWMRQQAWIEDSPWAGVFGDEQDLVWPSEFGGGG